MRFGLRPRLAIAGGFVFAAATVMTLGLLNVAESRLEDQAFDQLRAVREAKATQIESEVSQFLGNLDTLSNSVAAKRYLPVFADEFSVLNDVGIDAVEDYYVNEFAVRIGIGTLGALALVPEAEPGLSLQTLYIADNPFPVGEKDRLFDAGDGTGYSAAHATVHPTFQSALNNFGAYDIFLIDPDGSIVYSVFKEIDVGTNLAVGPHADSGLGEVWARSVATDDVAIGDFAPYVPSYLAPAAFAAQGVYGDDGTRLGTIAMQAPIDRINDVMTSNRQWADVGLGESGETYIVAADGTMRNDSRFLIEDPVGFHAALDDAEIDATGIRRFNTTIGVLEVDTVGTTNALAGRSRSDVFLDYRGVSVLSDYGPLTMPGGLEWVIMSEIDEAEAFDAASDMRRTSLYVLTTTGLVMVLAIWFGAGQLIRPIRKIEDETVVVQGLSFARGDHYDTTNLDKIATRRDELGDLAAAFSDLTISLEDNIGLRVAVEHELDIAAGIQRSLLPLVFPVPPEHVEFHLHADLVPAKEVGGDWYDWGTIDPDRHFFLVGDVSGKGVPAALFMAATKTLIRSGALSDEPLDQLLTRVNAEIAESNPEFMFATVWMGVLDVRTGQVTFVNAGHNPPLWITADGTRFITDRHGPFIGPVPGTTYTTGTFTLAPGDRLVVYSDGVTEAMSPTQELFGEERLEALVLPGTARDASSAIVDAVLAWEQGDRSDDVTVTVLDFIELRMSNLLTIEVSGDEAAAAIVNVNRSFAEFVERTNLSAEAVSKVQLSLDEIVSNVIVHGNAKVVVVELNSRLGWLNIAVIDDGDPFDPLSEPAPDTTLGLHERKMGGLGLHLVRSIMDDVNYTYRDGRNFLVMELAVDE